MIDRVISPPAITSVFVATAVFSGGRCHERTCIGRSQDGHRQHRLPESLQQRKHDAA